MLSQQIQGNTLLLQNTRLKASMRTTTLSPTCNKSRLKHIGTLPTLRPRTTSLPLCMTMIILFSLYFPASAFSDPSEEQHTPNIGTNFCTDIKEKYQNILTKIETDKSMQNISKKFFLAAEENFQQGRIKEAIDNLSKASIMLGNASGPKSSKQNTASG